MFGGLYFSRKITHTVLSFINLRRVSNTHQSLEVTAALLMCHQCEELCYIHNMSGEYIGKGSLRWNSGSIQEKRGDVRPEYYTLQYNYRQ